jgi:hypothetical protein
VEDRDVSVDISAILENKNGRRNVNIPEWFYAYVYGGIEELEKMPAYQGKYCFVGRNESANFGVLSKWADSYSVVYDFTRLAAARIEKRLFSASSLYPDDEYGPFFEKLVKKAFDTEFSAAIKEDTFWIRRANGNDESLPDIYEFFILISVDKTTMQTDVNNMISQARSGVTVSRAQNNALNRLQQNFFEGF